MKVGELFVSLGIKGSEKTLGALTGTQKGLKTAGSMALETKAALIGVMYTLERLFAASSRTGTDLTNMSTLLGVSVKTLQQYQYAARQVGISNQVMDGTFKSLQNTITKTLMGEGAPKGLAQVQQRTGEMGQLDMLDAQKNPEHLLQRLQLYAQREKNEGLRNEVLKSFGLGDEMVAALARNAFRPEVLNRAPTYSEGETKSLDKTNAAWANLGNKIEMSLGRFNAKHGQELVGNLSLMADKVLKLAEAFTTLADKAKLFEHLNKVFEGWALIFDGMAAVVDFIKEMDTDAVATEGPPELNGYKKESTVLGPNGDAAVESWMYGKPQPGQQQQPVKTEPTAPPPRSARAGLDEFFGRRAPPSPVQTAPQPSPVRAAPPPSPVVLAPPPSPVAAPGAPRVAPVPRAAPSAPRVAASPGAAKPVLKLVVPPSPSAPQPSSIAPNMPAVAPAAPNQNNVEVNQTLNFNHDGKDAKQTADSTKKAVKEAFLQIPAIGQGN